ncbi:Dihydroflavonol-4-reductase [Hordeum vulgare]|nr:Dihydroflavonol-4-reductase [Hordeum vulgare]
MRCSVTTAESDTRRLRHKNAKAQWLGFGALERLTRVKETTMARTALPAKEKARAMHKVFGYISPALESGISRRDNDDDSLATDAYTEEMDRHASDHKGMGTKW